MFRHITILSLTIALAAMAVLFILSGCGGSGSKVAVPMLSGVANINSNAPKPHIGLLYNGGSAFATYSSAAMPCSSSSWRDVNWSIPLPQTGAHKLYSICVFDDLDNNDEYTDSHELLGFAMRGGNYLYLKDDNDGTFSIINGAYGVVFPDASQCAGKDVYVDCLFLRSRLEGNEQQVFQAVRKFSDP